MLTPLYWLRPDLELEPEAVGHLDDSRHGGRLDAQVAQVQRQRTPRHDPERLAHDLERDLHRNRSAAYLQEPRNHDPDA
jgi:hypothetical protein